MRRGNESIKTKQRVRQVLGIGCGSKGRSRELSARRQMSEYNGISFPESKRSGQDTVHNAN
jgi:hypothetical protein